MASLSHFNQAPMKMQYNLLEEDYLKFQLYTASRSKQVKRQRFIGKYILPLVILLLGVTLWLSEDRIAPYILAGLAVLWFFAYPVFDRNRYIRYYKRFNKERYANVFGKPMSIETVASELLLETPVSKSSISFDAITEINDIGTHYFIHFNNGTVAVLPVNREVSRPVWDEFISELTRLSGKSVYDKKDWSWK